METDRFDALTRALTAAASRRGLSLLLAGGTLAHRLDVANAKKRHKKRRKNKIRKKNPCEGGCPPDVPLCCPERCCPMELPICCPHACCPNDPQIACGPTAESPCILTI